MLSIFLIATIQIVQFELSLTLSIQNDLWIKDRRFDPFYDTYLQTVLHMDIKELMKIPILDDDTFLSQLNDSSYEKSVSNSIPNRSLLDDTKLDDELIARSEIDETWEEVVVAGPIVVNYIGNLIVLSSKHDFPFTPPTPDHVYQYIKYPNSFRTTLVQIANQVYNTFIYAHRSMDQIQLEIQKIPTHLKTILKLLTSASPRLIQSMLPNALGNVERIAKQCANTANATLQNYKAVTALLHEVTEVTIGTYGSNVAELNETNMLIDASIQNEEMLQADIDLTRQRYDEARVALEKAREAYYNAYHDIQIQPKFLGAALSFAVGSFVGGGLVCMMTCRPPRPPDNTAFNNAMKRAELALKELKAAEEKYDQWYSELLTKQNNLAALIMQMSQLNMDQTDFKTTIDILVRATNEMTEIQKQWTNMTKFFNALSVRAEITQKTVVYEFVEIINIVLGNNEILDDADREFFILSIRDIADEIDSGAHLLYIMARTYYDVSSQYMINQISEITGFAVIQTDTERESRLKKLGNDTLSTSAAVSRMALERKQEYNYRNEARQLQYKQLIQELTAEELVASVGK